MNLDIIRKKNPEITRPKYLKKVDGLIALLGSLEQSTDDLLSKYDNIFFINTTISKRQVFEQVIKGTLTDDSKTFLNDIGNVDAHQNDNRNYVEYCIDLILGWLNEDAILNSILKQNIPASLFGVDANREFLKLKEIDGSPDIKIGYDDNFRLMDVFADWSNYWTKNGKADLRDNKYKRLEQDKSLLLGLSPLSQTAFLIDVSSESYGFEHNPNIWAYGGKPGYTTSEIIKHMNPLQDVLKNLYGMFRND